MPHFNALRVGVGRLGGEKTSKVIRKKHMIDICKFDLDSYSLKKSDIHNLLIFEGIYL